jgi:CRP/FNR family cyclic AMP-dependent transcriptional regulator
MHSGTASLFPSPKSTIGASSRVGDDAGGLDVAPSRAMLPAEVATALQLSFLGRLPIDVVEDLLEGQPIVDLPPDTTFYREGGSPRVFLMISGLVRLFLVSRRDRKVTVRYCRPPDVIGTALAVAGPLDVFARTITPTILQGIDVRKLGEAAHRDAAVAFALAEELSHRLDETLEQIAINAFGSVRQRVATHLLDLASSAGRSDGRLVAGLSQQDLADAVGSVREVVARALREFRAARLVATATDEIVILDAIGLFGESWGARGA